MPTKLSYSVTGGVSFNPPEELIGYLIKEPKDAFKELFPNYHIVNYLGLNLYLKDEKKNLVEKGLKLSFVPKFIGLEGKIEMFNGNEFFDSCFHSPFSPHKKREIARDMKKIARKENSVENLQKYLFILDCLGHSYKKDLFD